MGLELHMHLHEILVRRLQHPARWLQVRNPVRERGLTENRQLTIRHSGTFPFNVLPKSH